ncbi:MAG: glycosyltransferase [Patescibacteria group bacterium]
MKKSVAYKIAAFLITFSLLLIVSGKLLFLTDNVNLFLYAYGITVTFIIFLVFFVALKRYEDPYILAKENAFKNKKRPLVSLMVAVKNEERVIEECILSLINQDYENKEIIVVNDGSTDRTEAVLERFAKRKKIKLINLEENIGKKKALGRAMLEAKGEIFAFTDSDSVIASDAIARIVDILNYDSEIGAVSGHCRAMNAGKNFLTKIQDSWYEGQFSVRKAFESYFGAVTCVSGPLAVFRKEAIFNYIPAWENDAFLGQEFRFATDRTLTGFVLGSRVLEKKLKERYADSPFIKIKNYEARDWKIVYTRSARAWTNVPDNFSRVFKQQVRWKKSFIRNIFFTGRFYWRKPILPALIYYLHIVFVFVSPFIAFRHLVYIPILGNIASGIAYLAGIVFIGFLFGFAYKLKNKDDYNKSRWIYRPLMSLFSTFFLSWLVYYSMFTIKKMIWSRN